MISENQLNSLERRASEAENELKILKEQMIEIKKLMLKNHLQKEQCKLKAEVIRLLKYLNELEGRDGEFRITIKSHPKTSLMSSSGAQKTNVSNENSAINAPKPPESNKKEKADKKPATKKKTESTNKPEQVEEPPIDIGRLDLRIGKIMSVKKHPEADSLYIEEIDVGEGKLRTVVSGLVKHVTLDNMQDKMVVVLCNLKPAKMRGVTSEAMVMCASTPEKVELLVPPPTSDPGDLVYVDGYPRKPDSVMNPKKKIFETVAPDLKTNSNGIATYKGVTLTVADKGIIEAPTLFDVQIK